MRISIVDDMMSERRELRECILEWAETNGVDVEIGEFQSGRDFMTECAAGVPDIVFMDIYMNGENGLDVVAELRETATSCITIFITSSRDDALRAFPLHPFDYVVKPWNKETIFRVMNEASVLCQNSQKYVELKVGRQKTRILISQICYAVSDNHHVSVVTNTGKNIKSFSTFTEVSEELLRDSRFLICNRGIIVNMDYIDKSAEKCFVMKNGDTLPLKIKDIPMLKKTFTEYIFARTRRWK